MKPIAVAAMNTIRASASVMMMWLVTSEHARYHPSRLHTRMKEKSVNTKGKYDRACGPSTHR